MQVIKSLFLNFFYIGIISHPKNDSTNVLDLITYLIVD